MGHLTYVQFNDQTLNFAKSAKRENDVSIFVNETYFRKFQPSNHASNLSNKRSRCRMSSNWSVN